MLLKSIPKFQGFSLKTPPKIFPNFLKIPKYATIFKVVIHKNQWSRQLLQLLWQLEPTCKHMARQALAATPQIIETTGCIGSRLA